MLVKAATGDKPLSERMMAWFTDAYMHHRLVSIGLKIECVCDTEWTNVNYQI